jgi:hypothetical protein
MCIGSAGDKEVVEDKGHLKGGQTRKPGARP